MRKNPLEPKTASIVSAFVGAASAAKGHRHQWRLVLGRKPIAAEAAPTSDTSCFSSERRALPRSLGSA